MKKIFRTMYNIKKEAVDAWYLGTLVDESGNVTAHVYHNMMPLDTADEIHHEGNVSIDFMAAGTYRNHPRNPKNVGVKC